MIIDTFTLSFLLLFKKEVLIYVNEHEIKNKH